MRKLIFAAMVMVLAGCTVAGREADGPDFVSETIKTPQEYARCLAPKWLAMNPATTSIETDSGYKIAASATYYGVISLANVSSTSGGSIVEAYFPATRLGTSGWKRPVVDCL
ncbi:hypothetical protein [Stutzerimonas nitrititolerans]|uniref:hypothetical protein n=1 Tax=Stutzerimonas nitrititolerans TaxID=2482751 RepID=UPI0028A6BD39|nr:hypothetical protein [Stutzerimonas nitrititolerans]